MSINYFIYLLIGIFCSSGIWGLILHQINKRDGRTKLLLGLCHDRIFTLGMEYLRRGWVTREELTVINKYLAEPYFKLGGNGVVKQVMSEIIELPIKEPGYTGE